MSRLHRLRTTDRIFFVTANLHDAVAPLGDEDFRLIVEAFSATRRRLGFALCGYVVMPDHWHALLWPRPPLTISRVVKDIKQASADSLHRARSTKGPVWLHQFWDRFVRDAKEFANRLEYMHLNPVRSGLVARPEDWKWSSYRNFALEQSTVVACPIQIDYVRLPEQYRG